MKPPATLADLVAVAIAMGRLRVIAEGVRALPAPLPPARTKPMIRPEGCGPGRMLSRLPGIDAYDRMRGAR